MLALIAVVGILSMLLVVTASVAYLMLPRGSDVSSVRRLHKSRRAPPAVAVGTVAVVLTMRLGRSW